MWQTVIRIASKFIPFERIVAFGLNLLLKRYVKDDQDAADLERYRTTGRHLTEAVAGFNLALADGTVSTDEVVVIRDRVLAALDAWSEGEPTPDVARELLKD